MSLKRASPATSQSTVYAKLFCLSATKTGY